MANGYADKYLELIENEIIPRVQEFIKNELHKEIDYFGISGYSLGGLFALYSGYKTDFFKRIVSASGSMWYPNFAEYVKKNKISKKIDKIYFSLGNKEKNSKIEILKKVEDKTKEIYDFLSNNINTTYEENQGNHFQDGILRMAKGFIELSKKWFDKQAPVYDETTNFQDYYYLKALNLEVMNERGEDTVNN